MNPETAVLRRDRHDQMHMVWLHIQFQDLYLFFLLAQLIDLLLDIFSELTFENSVPDVSD